MENQEERGAKREAKESWRKCPICGQEFQAFIPLIKHVEEDCRRESQMVKVELGGKDYLVKKIVQEFLPSLQASGAEDEDGVKAESRRGRSPTRRKACFRWLPIGSSRLWQPSPKSTPLSPAT